MGAGLQVSGWKENTTSKGRRKPADLAPDNKEAGQGRQAVSKTKWKPAIIVPESRKRDRRVERILTRLGLACECSVQFGAGDTVMFVRQGEVKPVD
jgi:hypothetical protein